MTFELDATAQADQARRAQSNPLDPSELSPGFLTGAAKAPFMGLVRGVIAKPALLAGQAFTQGLRPIAKSVDEIFGTDVAGFLEDEKRKNVEVLQSLTPDPHTTGMAGHVLHGLFDVIPGALAGGPGAAALLEHESQRALLEAKGVDARTARRVAGVQAAATGVGVGLPLSLGLRAAPDLLYAAASNAVPGLEARAITRKLLAEGGYADMAAQYDPLDAAAFAADAVLGMFFAGAGHLAARALPSHVDAALSAKEAHHLELDTAPGIPRDPITRDAHVASVLKATEDLLAGRPVDVASRIEGADFQPNPRRGEVAKEVDQALRDHLGEAYDRVREQPLGPADDPLVRITSEQIGDVLVERGPAWAGKGEAEVKVGAFGLVKILWKHGEKSGKAPENQVTRADVLRVPKVVRDFVPIEDKVQADGKRLLEWQVQREDGKRVVYSVRKFTDTDGQQHVVSIFVNEGKSKRFAEKPLSEKTNRPAESPDVAPKALGGDTGRQSSSIDSAGGQKGGSEGTVAREAGKGEDPIVEQVRAAVAEMPDLKVMDEKGEVLPAAKALKVADEAVAEAENRAKAYGAAVSCFLRHGA